MCFAISSVFQTVIFLSQSVSPTHSVTQCLEPSVENGTLYYGKKHSYYEGDRLVIACDDEYTLLGLRAIKCMPDGAWSSIPPYCEEIVCPQIPQLVHGSISPHQLTSKIGTVINFTCGDSFLLLGPQQLTCFIDGSWYPHRMPYCKEAKCPNTPMIQNGTMLHANSEHYRHIHFTCDKGFTLKGPSYLACTEEGKWTPDVVPYCEEVEYPDIMCKLNDTMFFTCDKGFTLRGPSSEACTKEGQWTPAVMPYCEEVECPDILRLQNGTVSSINRERLGHVNFTCAKGFTLKGPSSLTCTEEGKWTPDVMPYCEEVECPDILCLQNGTLSSDNPERLGHVNFTCDKGFTLKGPSSLTCTEEGKWSPDVMPYCEEVECPDILRLQNGTVSSDNPERIGHVNFTCDKGFTLKGPSSLTCIEEGKWTPDVMPYCEEVKCPDILCLQNGTMSSSNSKRIGHVNFTCDKGFTLKGPSSLTCTEEGKWTPGVMPNCEEVECPDILRLQNGLVSSDNPERLGHVNFTCDKGFTLKGPSSLTCTEEGKWTPDVMPYCEEVDCPEVLHLQNGALLSDNPTRQGYVNFTCDKGFTLKGPSSLTCTEEGKWTPDLMPYCEEVECPDILCLQNGAILSDSLKLHGYVNFTCDKGFKLKGPSSLVCTEEGKWTPVMMPYCEEVKCPDILCINNGDMSSAKRHEYVNFTCDTGFTLKGPSSLTCTEEGKWTPDVVPNCEENSKTVPHDNRQDHDTTTWVKFAASIVFVYSCAIGLVCVCVRKDWISISLPSCCKHTNAIPDSLYSVPSDE